MAPAVDEIQSQHDARPVRTIAIDVDSVLADVMLIWVQEYNKRHKTAISKKDIVRWDIPTILPLTPEQVYEHFSYVWKHRWREIPPTEPDIGSLTKELNVRGFRVSIITKRERPTVPFVAQWLDMHDIYSDDLIFVYDAMPKADYPFDVLIDDAPINLIDVAAPKSAILFNQPWNATFDWPVRVNSLGEAMKLL